MQQELYFVVYCPHNNQFNGIPRDHSPGIPPVCQGRGATEKNSSSNKDLIPVTIINTGKDWNNLKKGLKKIFQKWNSEGQNAFLKIFYKKNKFMFKLQLSDWYRDYIKDDFQIIHFIH